MDFGAIYPLLDGLWTGLVGSVLVVWFLGSIIYQFRFSWWMSAARFDVLHLLPRWTFFAPNPGRYDFHVVYRDWVDDRPGPWRELAASHVDMRWRWIWNPARYSNKAISDLANVLFREMQSIRDEPWAIMLSASYICLMHAVMSQPRTVPDADRRQFAIVRTNGFGEQRQVDVAFSSDTHRAAA